MRDLPDDATYEDAMRRLYVLHKVEQGIADVEAGRVISHEEVKRQIAKWLR
jgi:predicted transcriptional regulator